VIGFVIRSIIGAIALAIVVAAILESLGRGDLLES